MSTQQKYGFIYKKQENKSEKTFLTKSTFINFYMQFLNINLFWLNIGHKINLLKAYYKTVQIIVRQA